MQNKKNNILRLGITHSWDTTSVPFVNTVYGDFILRNIYEPLVETNRDGQIVPLVAKQWEVNDDFTEYRFILDSNRKFSDGTKLTAKHFKDTWENSLRDKTKALSLRDVMQEISGFDVFPQTGKLDGVKVEADNVLLIKFIRPFRTALEFLASVRYAAVLEKDGKEFGTGPYIIDSNTESTLLLKENHFRSVEIGFSQIRIDVIDQYNNNIIENIHNKNIDGYIFAENLDITDMCNKNNSEIGCVYSAETAHSMFTLNNTPQSVFNSLEMRMAFAFLIREYTKTSQAKKFFEKLPMRYDLQFLSPLQKGRLEEIEVEDIISRGKNFVTTFIEKTKDKPLIFASMKNNNDLLIEYLRSTGIEFDKIIKIPSINERMKYLYNEIYTDIVQNDATVYGGDPDGLIHLLGRNARIRPKLWENEKVFKSLENGRYLLDFAKINEHYRVFSKIMLEEIPVIHFIFGYKVDVYNKNKVIVDDKDAKWETLPLRYFRPK